MKRNTKPLIAVKEKALHRRRGVALMLALVVLIIGGVLAGIIFDISYTFIHTNIQQRVTYVDHTTMIDIIQSVKGYIVQVNSDDGHVMHPTGYTGTSVDITDLSVIRFTDSPHPLLSSDRTIRSGAGLQYVTVNVYDTHYLPTQLRNPLRASPQQMKDLPAPIYMTVRSTTWSGGGMEDESEAKAPDVSPPPDDGSSGRFAWDKYGSYLIRVRLFHIDNKGNRMLARTAEEAFIQVLP